MVTRQNPYATPANELPIVAQVVDDENGITVEYENVLADAIAFSLFHHTQSSYGKRQVLTARIVILLSLLLLGGVLSYEDRAVGRQPILMLIFAVMGLVAWIFYPALLRYRLQRALTQMYSDGRTRAFDGPRRLTLSPEFLVYATPASQTVVRWCAIERVVVSDSYLLIYLSSVSAVTVPRHAFASPEAFDAFARHAEKLVKQASGAVA